MGTTRDDRQLQLFPQAREQRRPTSPAMHPLFFALLAEEPVAKVAIAAAKLLRQRHVLRGIIRPAKTMHVSLLGLGRFQYLSDAHIAAAKIAPNALDRTAFDMVFTHAVSWNPNADRHPLVLTCETGAAESRALGAALSAEMVRRNFAPHARLSFEPHMTLLYDEVMVPKTPLDHPIPWRVTALSLVRSISGEGRYEEEGRWDLT